MQDSRYLRLVAADISYNDISTRLLMGVSCPVHLIEIQVSIFLIDRVAGDEGVVDVDPAAVLFNPDFGEVAA